MIFDHRRIETIYRHVEIKCIHLYMLCFFLSKGIILLIQCFLYCSMQRINFYFGAYSHDHRLFNDSLSWYCTKGAHCAKIGNIALVLCSNLFFFWHCLNTLDCILVLEKLLFLCNVSHTADCHQTKRLYFL